MSSLNRMTLDCEWHVRDDYDEDVLSRSWLYGISIPMNADIISVDI